MIISHNNKMLAIFEAIACALCAICFAAIYRQVKLHVLIALYEAKMKTSVIILSDREDNKKHWNFLQSRHVLNIEYFQEFMDWYGKNPRTKTLDIIINTTGGSILSSDIIVNCLLNHAGIINVYIPRCATSAGALISLCGNSIFMNHYSIMGPTDPIIGFQNDDYSYSELKELIKIKGEEDISEEFLLGEINGRKLYKDNLDLMKQIIDKKHGYVKNKNELVQEFGCGEYEHNKIFNVNFLKSIGLRIKLGIPSQVEDIFSCASSLQNSFIYH
jgi:hypothetical protein